MDREREKSVHEQKSTSCGIAGTDLLLARGDGVVARRPVLRFIHGFVLSSVRHTAQMQWTEYTTEFDCYKFHRGCRNEGLDYTGLVIQSMAAKDLPRNWCKMINEKFRLKCLKISLDLFFSFIHFSQLSMSSSTWWTGRNPPLVFTAMHAYAYGLSIGTDLDDLE